MGRGGTEHIADGLGCGGRIEMWLFGGLTLSCPQAINPAQRRPNTRWGQPLSFCALFIGFHFLSSPQAVSPARRSKSWPT
jgi:hypothetical protein